MGGAPNLFNLLIRLVTFVFFLDEKRFNSMVLHLLLDRVGGQ
jgi:hypothetical protein